MAFRKILGVLWLPFHEPSFLLHDYPVDENDLPCLSAESYEENLELVKLWDSRPYFLNLFDLALSAVPSTALSLR